MTYCRRAGLALSAALLTVPMSAHATVTWDFYETAITFCNNPLSCHLQDAPIMSFTLSDVTETGFASKEPLAASITSDPSFTFSPGLTGIGFTSYHITWTEIDALLEALSITIIDQQFTVGYPFGTFGLTGGGISSDGGFGGCGGTQCIVSGYWVDSQTPATVPEPGAGWLFLGALIGTLGTMQLHRRKQ